MLGSFAGYANETPAACPTIAMSGTGVNCYGQSTGTALVNISNGSGSYTITWSNGANSTSINGLAAGTYTVNVKDNVSGCSVVGAYVVNSPDPIAVSQTITNVNCRSQATGAIDITVTGGTTPYSYLWSTGATTQDVTNLPAGNYTVQVTDAKGCTFNKNFTVTQPAQAVSASGVVTNASCFASATGAIDADVWGGTPPYSYSWSNSALTQDVGGLTAGNYTLTITDAKLCTLIQPFNVTQPTILTGTMSTTSVLCNGESTGSVSVSPSGGTAPYTCSWQNSTTLFSETGTTLSNIPADTYQVTVTDAKGCSFTTTATVNQPPALAVSESHVHVSCFGGNNGSINLTLVGGMPPYSFAWTNEAGTFNAATEDIGTLVAGIYTVLATDANGCEITLTQEITQPNMPITVVEVITDVLCHGNNTGAIDLTVTGGTPPYAYSWTSGPNTEDINSLLAGTYGYTVTDAMGCSESDVLTVTEPAQALQVTNVITDVNCYGESNGTIDLTVSGGTAPYTYEWSNSGFLLSNTGQDLTNYPADSYRYEVTDAHGCKEIDTLDITQPPLLETTISGVNILCYGGNNGSVDLGVTGGVMPYSYLWNNSAVTQDLSSLYAGTYSVQVLDAHNCPASNQITLTQPSDTLSFEFSVIDVKCNDGEDGEIDLVVSGGTTPYAYDWSNGDVQSHIVDLTAGYYEFVVTDFNGCLLVDSIYVDQPDALTLNEQITVVTCYGLSDGAIDISPVGGTVPYAYTWYNSTFALSAQTQDLIDFPADVYQLEIIDSNNCFYEAFFEIIQPDPLEITYTFNVVSCAGGSDGNIQVNITGGNPAYNTTWSNGATTEDLLNVIANEYQLVVVDQKNCTDSIQVDISQPDTISVDFSIEEVTCIDQFDGIAYAYPVGGNGGYLYNWSNGSTSFEANGLSNDWYSVLITDMLGCTGADSIFITKNTKDCVDPVNAFSPNEDMYNDTWVIDNMELYPDAEVQIFNRWGNLIHHQTGIYSPWDGSYNGNQVPSDTYYYIINLNQPEREHLKGNITIVR